MRNNRSVLKEKEVKLNDISQPKVSLEKTPKAVKKHSRTNFRNSKQYINIQIK